MKKFQSNQLGEPQNFKNHAEDRQLNRVKRDVHSLKIIKSQTKTNHKLNDSIHQMCCV